MGKTRQNANQASGNNLFVDIDTNRVGVGTTIPSTLSQISSVLYICLSQISFHCLLDTITFFKFAFGSADRINSVYESLGTLGALDTSNATSYVYIIDKEWQLRGRTSDGEMTLVYGYDANDYAVVNNEMNDDIKIVLAEYRLALKKYKSARAR